MTRLALAALLTADHAFGEARRYWKRILVGAAGGWLVASVLGAVALAFLPVSDAALPFYAAAIVWSCTGLGALVGYGTRPKPEVKTPHEMYDGGPYELYSPKHPTYHERYADLWDNREKFE